MYLYTQPCTLCVSGEYVQNVFYIYILVALDPTLVLYRLVLQLKCVRSHTICMLLYMFTCVSVLVVVHVCAPARMCSCAHTYPRAQHLQCVSVCLLFVVSLFFSHARCARFLPRLSLVVDVCFRCVRSRSLSECVSIWKIYFSNARTNNQYDLRNRGDKSDTYECRWSIYFYFILFSKFNFIHWFFVLVLGRPVLFCHFQQQQSQKESQTVRERPIELCQIYTSSNAKPTQLDSTRLDSI